MASASEAAHCMLQEEVLMPLNVMVDTWVSEQFTCREEMASTLFVGATLARTDWCPIQSSWQTWV